MRIVLSVPLLLLAWCGEPPTPPRERPPPTTRTVREAGAPEASTPTPVSLDAAIAETDRRELGPAITALTRSARGEDRAQGARLAARLRGPSTRQLLERLDHDAGPNVRLNAAAAWGQQTDEPEAAERSLLAIAASDDDLRVRASAVRALGRVATELSEPLFLASLAASEPGSRAAACHAIGLRATTGRMPTTHTRAAVAQAALAPLDESVAVECAFAIGRFGQDVSSREVVTASVIALLRHPDPDARSLATRAAGQLAGVPIELLASMLEDPELRVRVGASRALGTRAAGDAAMQRRGLVATHAQLDRSPHPLMAYLEVLEGRADSRLLPELQRIGRDLAQRARRGSPHADRALGLVHCAITRVMDRIAGRPASVPHCGLRLLDAATVAVHHAEVLATLADIPAFVRGDALLRLHRQGNARVRIAVLSAAASVDDPRLSEIAIEALLGRDEGLVASAAELLTAHPERFRAADGAPRPEVVRALARALATPHLEARLSTIRAIEKVGDESLIGPLGPHLVSPNEEVRRAAAAAFRAIRRRDPPNATDATAPVPHLVSTEVIEAGRRSQALELETTRGMVRIVLENSAAPTTVARIVELAARGFYDGLTFHRVVPGFVVQGGDPRGDGYGGPAWDQRCEDRPDAPYVRGTVGMALAGRDTGGSQFFVTYGRQPHLDGGYTPFAHVESGMDVLERIVPGDVITRVRVIPR